MNILVVDDIETNRKLLRAILEAEGHAVFEAADGVAALEVLERQKMDAVISDILMPRMDGFRLCQEIRKHPRFSALPFIVFTSTYKSPADRKLAELAGADKYVIKPAPAAVILQAVAEVTARDKRRVASPHAPADEGVLLQEYNASLVRKLEERNLELENRSHLATLTADVGTALTHGNTLKETLQRCVEAIARNLGAAFARIWTLDENENVLTLQASAGMYTHIDGSHARVPVGPFKIGLIAEERKPHLTNSVVGDPRVPEQAWAIREGLVAFAGYPLIVGNRLVGVVAMFARQELPEATLATLAAVADAIALGVQRKRAEEELRATQDQLQHLLENSPAVIYSLKVEGERVIPRVVSENVKRMLGFTAEECLSYDWWVTHLHPEDRERAIASVPETLKRGVSSTQYRFQNRDGGYLWVEDTRRVLHDAEGKPTDIVGAWTDISERTQLKLELHESERRFSDMMAKVQLISIMLDKDARITYCNDYLLRLTGWQREDVLGHNWFELFVPSENVTVKEGFKALISDSPDAWHQEHEILTRSGQRRLIQWNNSVLRSVSGDVMGTASIGEDITERKKAQSQMLRAQRLESIGTLAGGIAHDLNNALAPVLMATELMRMQYPDAREIIETVEESVKRGADMVRQLLTFAKGVEGQRLLIQPLHLLKEMEKIVKGSFPKNIQLRTKYAQNLQQILGDATQLHQVLLNLCVNARDAMPGGGTLTMEAENVEIDPAYASAIPEAKAGHYVTWRVMDTGAGIPSEILERIFEPFFTTKGPEKGTGLGLSTLLGIVRSHGGFVRVYSQPGLGSTFSIYLPASSTHAGETALLNKADTHFRGNGEVILVVDDEANMRQVARSVLTSLNFQVTTAADGTEALIQVAEKRAELRAVITDVHMPHMDGLSFVRVLKHMLPKVGVIVTSGHLNEREAAEFKALGVAVVLNKPFSQEKLVEALKTVFENQPGKIS